MTCALCQSDNSLNSFAVPNGAVTAQVDLCAVCTDQQVNEPDPNHWRALATTMWSEDTATQVLAYRMLTRLSEHDWARDLLDMLYLEDDVLAWAKSGIVRNDHKDSNGAPLMAGDNVVLIKDLPVKGAGFTAKRGTAVRGISLVEDNPAHIEGRVEGQRIVILTEFVKKK